MALDQTYKTPASEVGAVLGPNGIVDAKALSDAAGLKRVTVALANFTINTTQRAYGGPLGFRGKLVAAYFSAETLPAGGTLSVQPAVYDASANAEVALGTVNPESAGGAVSSEGKAVTLNSTNDDFIVEADDTIRVLSVADNNTVTQQQVSGFLTMLFAPLEPTAGTVFTER